MNVLVYLMLWPYQMAYVNNVIYGEHLFLFTWGPGPAVLVQPLGEEKGGGLKAELLRSVPKAH